MPDPWPKLNAGEMIHRVTIQRMVPAVGRTGNTFNWTDWSTGVWAKIVPVRGTDVVKGGQDTTQLYVTISIWWMPGILASMRVVGNGKTYVIQSVENIQERNIVLVLNCLLLGDQKV
jgi:SPP1 family predicted phage head-tail adaptor